MPPVALLCLASQCGDPFKESNAGAAAPLDPFTPLVTGTGVGTACSDGAGVAATGSMLP